MRKTRFARWIAGSVAAVLGLAVLGAVVPSLTSVAWAEEASNPSSTLVVSPMYQKIILTPGESWNGSIKVLNPKTATQSLKYTVAVGSYSESSNGSNPGDYGTVDVRTVTDYNQMMEWITLGKTEGELEPNESEEIPFTINVPADAPGGGQYASIVVEDATERGQNGSNVMIDSVAQIASILYATVTGDTQEEGDILDNSVPVFVMNNSIETSAMVENQGNVHGDATYTLQVWPLGSDEEICTNEEEPDTNLVLPGTKMYHMQSCEVSPVGIYKVKQTVNFMGDSSTVERTVVVCPIWLIVVVIAGIGVIVYLVIRSRKGRK